MSDPGVSLDTSARAVGGRSPGSLAIVLDSAAASELRVQGDSLRPHDLDAIAFARDSIWHP